MISFREVARAVEELGALSTPAQIAAAIALLEPLTSFLPEPAARLASLGLLIARDQALAGNGPEKMEELRASIRAEWQAEIDRRFPKG